MSRLFLPVLILVIIIGALVYLSTVPKQKPTHTIEIPVSQGGNAH